MTQWEYHLWCEGVEWIGWCPNVDVYTTGTEHVETYLTLVEKARKKFLEVEKESLDKRVESRSNHSLTACLQA